MAGRHTEGRHRQLGSQHRRLGAGSAVAAVTVLILVVGLSYLTLSRRSAPTRPHEVVSSAQPSQPALPPQDLLPATAGASPCTLVRVRAALENAELLRRLVQAYQGGRRNIVGHCVQLTVTADSSGSTASDIEHGFASLPTAERPELWVPDSSAWRSLVAARRSRQGSPLVQGDGTSIALSYLVLAMPQTLADIIGWRSTPPTWATFLESTTNRDTWRRSGHSEFGDFKLGKTSPAVASSGLYTLVAEYGAAAGKVQSPAISDVNAASNRDRVAATERSVVHYMSTEQHILWHARQAEHSPGGAGFLSVVPVSERGMWEYDRGVTSRDGLTYVSGPPPHQPLVPIYPADGTYALDNPGLVLDAPWVTPGERAAAQDFLRFAVSREGQAVARKTGYRDLAGTADPDVAGVGHYADPSKLRTLPPPSGELLAAVQDSFPTVRKRARVLFLVDLSKSMTEPTSPTVSRLQAAQQAIAKALPYFTDADEVGLAGFSHLAGRHAIVPGLVAPVAPLRQGRSAFLTALRGLKAVQATPLYAATEKFTAQMAAGYRPDWINAVVLLSDGHNETQTFTETLASMSAGITRATKDRPVLVFTLAYANKADVPTLQAIAKLTHAHYYDATNPARLDRVLGDLVTSF
jgi:Ca-activated chloride channel family protein